MLKVLLSDALRKSLIGDATLQALGSPAMTRLPPVRFRSRTAEASSPVALPRRLDEVATAARVVGAARGAVV